MKRILSVLMLVVVCSITTGQEKLNGVVQIDMANSTDNNSPGITVKLNDDFLYDGKYLNHYGIGFHDYQDVSSPLNGRNAYMSGYFGIDFFTAGSNRLRLNYNGNVGIGNSNPKNKLEISNAFSFHSGGHKVIGLGYSISNGAMLNGYMGEIRWDPTNGFLSLRTSTTKYIEGQPATMYDRVYIRKDGNVGIGTSNPDGKLHINGGIAIQNPTLSYDTNGNAGERAGIIFGTNHPTNNSMFWISPDATQGNRLNIGVGYGYNDNGAKLTIENNGEVGIGTTSPSAKLDVAGNIKAHEIEVTLAAMQDLQLNGTLAANNITYAANGNTADFVFEDNYHLKDLSEVEAFIKSNKHLPEIPSAEEMEEAGVNLAEMNKLLLMKVEELTLYSIELEKKVMEERKERRGELVQALKMEEEKRKVLEERLNQMEKILIDLRK